MSTQEMTHNHAAGWLRFQKALLKLADDPKQYKYLLNSERHRDAVDVLGRGTEEELKYEMLLWRMDYPKLFENARISQ